MAHNPFVLDPARLHYKLEIKPGRVRNPRLRGIRVMGQMYRLGNPFDPNVPGEVVEVWVPGLEGTMIIDEWRFHTSGCPSPDDFRGHRWTVEDNDGKDWEFWPEEFERNIADQTIHVWGGLFEIPGPPAVQPGARNYLAVKRSLDL